MKRNLFTIIGLSLLISAFPTAAQPPGAGAPPAASTNDYSKIFKDEKERNGYVIGMSQAKSITEFLKRNGLEFETNAMINGFKDTVTGATAKVNDEQFREIIGILQREARARQMEQQKIAEEKRKADAEKNKKDGEAFLAAKKTESGVIPLPSGLMYKVITEGTGESPKVNDTVSVNYKGTLIDGSEFDSSEKNGKPVSFRINSSSLITGWVEALQLMKPGAKWQLFIPADLAYKERGLPPKIGPSAVLIFELELVSFQPTPAAAITQPSAPLTSDIIKVPSAEELKKGAKIETIKAEDIEKERLKEAAKTNK